MSNPLDELKSDPKSANSFGARCSEEEYQFYKEVVADYVRRKEAGSAPSIQKVLDLIEDKIGKSPSVFSFRRHVNHGVPEV